MATEINTLDDYVKFQQAIAEFFDSEGINCLTTDCQSVAYFDWRSCDCCNGTLGGNRYYASGYNPTTKEVQSGYSVCEDCIYFVKYGELPDETMMRIQE